MSTSQQILSQLQDGRFHSGESLAQMLSISRSAIWKSIKQLTDKGLDIHSVKGRGYRLAQPLELLDREKIISDLPDDKRSRFQIETHFELVSTNQHLLHKATTAETGEDVPVCLAEYQSAGRGRRGRNWVSPLGANLYLSLLWRHQLGPQAIAGMSLVSAVALAQTLTELGLEGVGLKWPNDVFHKEKKLAGILLEMSGEAHGDQQLVIGIGINVAMPQENAGTIDQPWTDLQQISGKIYSRNRLSAALLTQLDNYFKLYEQYGMEWLIPKWAELDAFRGRVVELKLPERKLSGKVAGIDEQGRLLLDTDDNQQLAFISGEVSLRPG